MRDAILTLIDVPGEPARLTVLRPHAEPTEYHSYQISDEALPALAADLLNAVARRMRAGGSG